MRKVYEDVLIFCPEVKTGGPEALHQLGYRIACHGGTAHMVYYAPFSRIEVEDGVLRCHAEASPMPAHFARYHPQVLTDAKLGPDTLIVFPEPLSHFATKADVAYQRALWWLSLDNGLPQNPGLVEDDYRHRFFADPGLAHFYQSDYARDYLRQSRSVRYHPLSDYTDQDFVHRSLITSENPPIGTRGNTICFFPNKGAELAARFIDARAALPPGVEFVPIRDMTKAQVRDTLFGARLYIDFGHHPGKDRVPREASVAMILDEPDRHFANQRYYRNAILLERERFDLEVRAFFFTDS